MHWSTLIADGGFSWRSGCCFDPITLMVGGAALSAGGTIIGGMTQASAMEAQAEQIKTGADFTAKQQQMAAAESRAAGQRQAFEKQRLAKLALSSLQARAAATGDAGSQDVIALGADIAGRGEYQTLADLYSGENRARGMEDAALATRMNAEAKAEGLRAQAQGTRFGSLFSAGGTILSGASKIGRDRARLDYG